MPYLFFMVKVVTGCRLDDICNLRSKQMQDGRVIFGADITKNRSERYAILPTDLYAELDAYKGESYLWERYPAELKEAIAKKGTRRIGSTGVLISAFIPVDRGVDAGLSEANRPRSIQP